MALHPGTRLGPYEILSALGAGGMGEVYRARDTRLGRDIAIKILRQAVEHDPDRTARFRREAQVLAALNHPNIGAIHGLEDLNGGLALVLELVEGPTLAERIASGPIPLDETLSIARQIAVALEVAHEQGIVHRDLKPANIKVRDDGTVKVLDFGLAKLGLSPTSERDSAQSPTVTSPAMTAAGFIVGTAAYMSPEQAKGRPADKRSDIWAFGCVLYEMLTRRQPFLGETVTETLAGVLKGDLEFDRLPAETPEAIRRLLRRCLQRDPKLRLREAADAVLELDEAGEISPTRAVDPIRVKYERLAWALACLLATSVAAVAVWWSLRPDLPILSARLEIATPPTSNPDSLAVAPNGRMVVYAATTNSGSNLWVRELDALTPRMLPGTQDGTRPFWSPDSRAVGFFASGALKRVDIDGGTAQIVTAALNGYGGAWSRDGTIIFVPNAAPQALMRVPASGGQPTIVETTRLQPQQYSQSNPQFLPDDRHFIYSVSGPPELGGVYLASLDGLAASRLVDASAGVYSAGQLLFQRQGTVFSQPFDLRNRQLTGAPRKVADEVVRLVASDNGVLVYRTGSSVVQRRLRWFDRQGKAISDVDGGGNLDAPEVSPDGRRIAGYAEINGNVDVWMIEGRGVRTRFTVDPAVDNFPLWSPDGQQVVFSTTRLGGPHNLFIKPAVGGDEVLLLSTGEVKTGNDWSSDGKYLLFRSSHAATGHDLWALTLSDRKAFPVVRTPFAERDGVFSPDTKWIAYQSDQSGRFEIYVQAFPEAGPRTQISTAGGAQVRWSRDGRELFYVAMDGRLMSVPITIDSARQVVEPGTPIPLFDPRLGPALQGFLRQQYGLSPDGQRFLINAINDDIPSAPLIVILNWRPAA